MHYNERHQYKSLVLLQLGLRIHFSIMSQQFIMMKRGTNASKLYQLTHHILCFFLYTRYSRRIFSALNISQALLCHCASYANRAPLLSTQHSINNSLCKPQQKIQNFLFFSPVIQGHFVRIKNLTYAYFHYGMIKYLFRGEIHLKYLRKSEPLHPAFLVRWNVR